MKYFLHDTNSFDDEKITALYLKFGYEGLGLFYTALEKMGKQEKPIRTDILKAQLRVGKRLEKCWKFMEEIGIISSNNGETFNKQLLNFSETYQIKKEKTREKVSEWRKRQEDIKNVTSYVPVSNPPKVKESKVKESKIKKNKKIIYPSLKEVEEYFDTNGFKLDIAIKAFNYYSVADWHDSKGNKILNWKQKMQAVWFKDENKINGSVQKELPNHIIATSGTKFK
jgi:hypothetical protein